MMRCTTCGHNMCDPCWQARSSILSERDALQWDVRALRGHIETIGMHLVKIDRDKPPDAQDRIRRLAEQCETALRRTMGVLVTPPDIDALRAAQALRILDVLERNQAQFSCGTEHDGSWWVRGGTTGHVYRGADLQDTLGQLTNVLLMEEAEAIETRLGVETAFPLVGGACELDYTDPVEE